MADLHRLPAAWSSPNGRGPVPPPGPRVTVRTHDEWLAAAIPPPRSLIDGLLAAETTAYWHGPAGSLKTWWELAVARALAAGRDLLGRFATAQAPVLVLDAESNDAGLQDRLRMLDRADPLPPGSPLYVATVAGVYLNDPAGWATLDELCRRYQPGAVFFDSAVRFHQAEENSSGGMADFHAAVRAIVRDHRAGVALLDHVRKRGVINDPEERQRGSSEKRAFADSALDFDPGKGVPPTATVTPHKSRWGELAPPFVIRLEVDRAAGTARLVDGGSPTADSATRQHEVVAAITAIKAQVGEDAADVLAIAGWLGVSPDTARRYVAKLRAAGLVRGRKVGGTGGRPKEVFDVGGRDA